MRALRSLAAGLALAAAASPALAQTPGTLTLTGGGPTTLSISGVGTVSVGPYDGRINGPGTPVIDVYCVDYNHWATVGSTWNVNITNLGLDDLGATRGGNAALAQYQQMAWLTTQYNGDNAQTKAIQTAIWNIMSPAAPDLNPAGLTNDTAYWIAQAQSRYLENGASFYEQFVVLTPTDRSGRGSPQEFVARVTPTPEPSTYLLLGSGLAGLFGVARVRRKGEGRK